MTAPTLLPDATRCPDCRAALTDTGTGWCAACGLRLTGPEATRLWEVDVELLGRLMAGSEGAVPIRPDQMLEVPLRAWVDVGGSKMSLRGAAKAGLDLASLGARVVRRGPRGFFP